MAPCVSFATSFAGASLAARPQVRPVSARGNLQVVAGDGVSRIGKKPVSVPKGVTYTLDGHKLSVKGPKGSLESEFRPEITITEENDTLVFTPIDESREAKQLHGLTRSLANNMFVGVSEGFEKKLELIGVGYRSSVAGKQLTMNVGYSHPVIMEIPESCEVSVEKNTLITISGYDKAILGNFAANVRATRPPEPYKGKGVRYVDEYVRRKEGKSGR